LEGFVFEGAGVGGGGVTERGQGTEGERGGEVAFAEFNKRQHPYAQLSST
jgi:hypothetical protein